MGRAYRVIKRTAHITVQVGGKGVVGTMGQKVHPIGFRLGFNKTWR